MNGSVRRLGSRALIVLPAAAVFTGVLPGALPASASAPADVTAQQCRDGGGTVHNLPFIGLTCIDGIYHKQHVSG
ncbi:hypothetical protein [Actinomadura oligospora]|uniref:hypothetical protein n=1 Tax=Actinomadura oligospora TaxID=111804 RepID=UPI00047CF99D|nr:hypothetical protein [Actinomadura oligospora]